MGFLLQITMSCLYALSRQVAGAGAVSWLCVWWRQVAGAGAGCRCWCWVPGTAAGAGVSWQSAPALVSAGCAHGFCLAIWVYGGVILFAFDVCGFSFTLEPGGEFG